LDELGVADKDGTKEEADEVYDVDTAAVLVEPVDELLAGSWV
jgi:hypothetical protein